MTRGESHSFVSREIFTSALDTLRDYIKFDFSLFEQHYPEHVDQIPIDLDLVKIDEEMTVKFARGYLENDGAVTVDAVVNGADAVRIGKLKDRTFLRMKSRSFVNCELVKSEVLRDLGMVRLPQTLYETEGSFCIEDSTFSCKIVTGLSAFSFAIIKDGGLVDRYHEACWWNSCTIVIEHPDGCSDAELFAVCDAYLFEIASQGRHVFGVARFEHESDFTSDDEENLEENLDPLEEDWQVSFPRLQCDYLPDGAGITDLLKIWMSAKSTHDSFVAVLSYVRALEFVAPACSKVEIHERLRGLIRSCGNRILSSSNLDVLIDEVLKHGNSRRKDSELIRMVVLRVAIPGLLHPLLRKFDPQLADLVASENPQSVQKGLSAFAEVVSDTRNSLVHAKSNYTPTGREIAQDDLDRILPALSYISLAAIRWYGSLPESARV